jgi:endoglucanase
MRLPAILTIALTCCLGFGATAQFVRAADAAPEAGGPPGAAVVKVSGNHLVDGSGALLQLRGVNVSGLEFYPILNTGDSDYWGGQSPDLKAIRSWHANAIRVPLNEQSYLAQTCFKSVDGKLVGQKSDPNSKYRSVVKGLVDRATAAGMYVILDLHKNAPPAVIPGSASPVQICSISQMQQEMADAVSSIAFWTAVATDYKSYPNVIFDLFNEPHVDNFNLPQGRFDPLAVWRILRDGGEGRVFYGNDMALTQTWRSAGMQGMLDAVRGTGSRNVVMVSGISWAQDLGQWLQVVPADPQKQLALSWHAYPMWGKEFGTPEYNQPGLGPATYQWAESILKAGYPIIIGETGDHSAPGNVGAPFLAVVLKWADAHGVSVLGWGWNAWGHPSANLIKDPAGTPTDGYGQAFKSWLIDHK